MNNFSVKNCSDINKMRLFLNVIVKMAHDKVNE